MCRLPSWSAIQSPEEMEVNRRFEYDDESLTLIKRWLKVGRQTKRVVEIGSGSGYFTKKLLGMIPSAAKLTCVEPDDRLRDYAGHILVRKLSF
jgi:predicted O-methyltransferase YrrM